MKPSSGVRFQLDWRNSVPVDSPNIYIERLKDPPPMFHNNYTQKGFTPKNPYDFIVFKSPCLFPMELKSTQLKSFSFSEKIIKAHQIQCLQDASYIKGVHAGFVFNFRELREKNGKKYMDIPPETYWVEIDDFIDIVENSQKKSISVDDCRRIGIKVEQVLKRVNWKYNIDKLLEDIVKSREVDKHE